MNGLQNFVWVHFCMDNLDSWNNEIHKLIQHSTSFLPLPSPLQSFQGINFSSRLVKSPNLNSNSCFCFDSKWLLHRNIFSFIHETFHCGRRHISSYQRDVRIWNSPKNIEISLSNVCIRSKFLYYFQHEGPSFSFT